MIVEKAAEVVFVGTLKLNAVVFRLFPSVIFALHQRLGSNLQGGYQPDVVGIRKVGQDRVRATANDHRVSSIVDVSKDLFSGFEKGLIIDSLVGRGALTHHFHKGFRGQIFNPPAEVGLATDARHC